VDLPVSPAASSGVGPDLRGMKLLLRHCALAAAAQSQPAPTSDWSPSQAQARSAVNDGCSLSTISYVGFILITANTLVNVIANVNNNVNNNNNNNNSNNNNNNNSNNNNNAGRGWTDSELERLVRRDPVSPEVARLLAGDGRSVTASLAAWAGVVWRHRRDFLLDILRQTARHR